MLNKVRENKKLTRIPSNTRELYKQLYQEPKVFNTKDYVDSHVEVAHKFTIARRELYVYSYLCRQQEVREWLEQTLNEKFPQNSQPTSEDGEIFQRSYKSDLFPVLRDGMRLCSILNLVEPNLIKIKESNGKPFLMLENINFFLDVCKTKLSFPDYKLFLPLDLLERKNMPRVIYCLHQFANYVFEKYGVGLKIVEKTGEFQFSQEEIDKAQRDLDEYELEQNSSTTSIPADDNSEKLEQKSMRTLEESIRLHNLEEIHNSTKFIQLNQFIPYDIVIVGNSKSENISGNSDDNYSLGADVEFVDGTKRNFRAPFSVNSHDWETQAIYVSCEGKCINSVNLYPIFIEHSGKVWFDGFNAVDIAPPSKLIQFVQNPSFEIVDSLNDKLASHWKSEGNGYQRTNETHYLDGEWSAVLTNQETTQKSSLSNHVVIYQTNPAPLFFDVWSKAENVSSSSASADYGVNFQIIFGDDTKSEYNLFLNPGTHDWEHKLVNFDPKDKPVKELTVTCSLKNQTGTVYFDHVQVCQEEFKQYVQNPSFEMREHSSGLATHWKPEALGYKQNYKQYIKYGHTSIEFNNPDATSSSGASQFIQINQKKPKKLIFSAFNKAENVSGDKGYGILANITFQNGSTAKQFIPFTSGTHDWEEKEFTLEPSQPVKSVNLTIQLQDQSGRAFVDNVNILEEYEFAENELFMMQVLLKEGASSAKEDADWLDEMTELKRRMLIELRKNHQLEKELEAIDHKIALLIKNRIDVQEVIQARKRFFKFFNVNKEKKDQGSTSTTINSIRKNINGYQHLFYLLQTEPKYLAKVVYLISQAQMESFLETVILTLFGDVYSPREEYLLLQLLREATENEIKTFKDIAGFLEANTVISKMIVTYNRREQGQEYLVKTLAPILQRFIQIKDLDLEISPQKIQHQLIADHEMRTGTKSDMEKATSDEEARRNSDVKRILEERVETLQEICSWFLEAILSTIQNLPYGLRWISKQIVDISTRQFAKQTKDEIQRTISYFVYYRFLNPAIVSPDLYNVIRLNLNNYQRKNLIQVSKILQTLFNFSHGTPLDTWINLQKPKVVKYLSELVNVPDITDFLMVDNYVELTQGTKPIILMTYSEIYSTHELILQNLNQLARDPNDRLQVIIKELGSLPEFDLVDDDLHREFQLVLVNRFADEQEQKTLAQDEEFSLTDKTRDAFMELLVLLPLSSASSNLDDILEHSKQFASKDSKIKQLSQNISENLQKLVDELKISRKEVIQAVTEAIQTKVDNQTSARLQRRNIIKRLRLGLENLLKSQSFMNQQVDSYNVYLKSTLDRQRVSSKKDKSKNKPVKYSYSKLAKQGIIVSSSVPEKSRKHTTFTISYDDANPNEFQVKAKIAGITAETKILYLDQLLEKQSQSIENLDLEDITLNVNLTIHLINKTFLQKN